MTELVDLAIQLQRFFLTRGWRFCFIGGLVVQRWGEPRLTKDVDLTLLTGFGGEEIYVDELLKNYEGRIPDAREFALAKRVLLLRNESGLSIDIALGAFPFEESAIARAVDVELKPGFPLRFCTPEDLIVMKAFANRPQDLQDIRMTIVRQGVQKLDWKYIFDNLKPLADLKEEPQILTQLEALRKKYS